MGYTPVELRHVKVGRSLFGYDRGKVEQLLDEVADSFEVVWRDRGELTDQVHELQKQLAELRAREQLLTQTLVAAEGTAVEVRDQARREAELIIAEAHNDARSVARNAQAERDRLMSEARRVEGFLRAALGLVDEAAAASPEPVEAPALEAPAAAVLEADDTIPPAAIWPVEEMVDAEAEPPQTQGPHLRRVVGGEDRDFDWGD
jgi:cell division initiation protein